MSDRRTQSTFWRLAHKLPWSVTRWFCDLCAEFPFDPKTWPPTATVVGTTGPPMPVICVECGRSQTHRVCSICFYGSRSASG